MKKGRGEAKVDKYGKKIPENFQFVCLEMDFVCIHLRITDSYFRSLITLIEETRDDVEFHADSDYSIQSFAGAALWSVFAKGRALFENEKLSCFTKIEKFFCCAKNAEHIDQRLQFVSHVNYHFPAEPICHIAKFVLKKMKPQLLAQKTDFLPLLEELNANEDIIQTFEIILGDKEMLELNAKEETVFSECLIFFRKTLTKGLTTKRAWAHFKHGLEHAEDHVRNETKAATKKNFESTNFRQQCQNFKT